MKRMVHNRTVIPGAERNHSFSIAKREYAIDAGCDPSHILDLGVDDLVVALPKPFSLGACIDIAMLDKRKIDVATPKWYDGPPAVWNYQEYPVFGEPLLIDDIKRIAFDRILDVARESLEGDDEDES